MIILAIESSCDETSAALIEDGVRILSNIVASSKSLHEKTGGIIPEIAAREQVKCILPVIKQALGTYSLSQVDAIAVTIGPGLIGSLLVGIECAKTMAYVLQKPIIPVHHIFAHMYANWLTFQKSPEFPLLGLVVSGGHTELFYITSHDSIRWLGGTRDDASGEAFDKTARLLGLGYPGGPIIAAEAAKFKNPALPAGRQSSKFKITFPRPIMHEENCDFSFSGLKTAVMREVNHLKEIDQFNNSTIQQLSYELQESITDILVHKTLYALSKYPAKGILIGGGVAANNRLTEKFQLELSRRLRDPVEAGKIDLFIPPPSLCTDNAAYIGSYAFFHNKPVPWQQIQAHPDLTVEV